MKKAILFALLLLTAGSAFGQFSLSMSIHVQPSFDYLSHSPGYDDNENVTKYGYLLSQLPDSSNYEAYSAFAASLWELGRLEEAKQLYLHVILSDAKIVEHSSCTKYGYGSFTASYKNEAAVMLALIYVEQQQFDSALLYLKDAIKKYKVNYTCGTGHAATERRYQFIYASIYEGKKEYNKVLDMLLPKCLERNDQIVVRTIKRLYAKEEIKKKLQMAEKLMQCSIDKEPSYYYRGSLASSTLDTITYYSGSATITLFDRQVNIQVPSLENGEHMTREKFIKEFRGSSFYTSLMND